MILFDKIAPKLPPWRERIAGLVKECGSVKICDVTIEQLYGGIRGVQIQVSDISYVDPLEGIRLRGYTIPETLELLPKLEGTEFPLTGGIYYLLMVDEMPTLAEALEVEEEWKRRSQIPEYVLNMLRSMPPETHPMTLLSMGITALQNGAVFPKRYDVGMPKVDYWEATLEDSLNLTAKLPALAAFIYNQKYHHGRYIPPDPSLDWSANFAHMIGKAADTHYHDLSRLFFLLHSDHEGGNVSAHTAHLVNSALSDIYLTCAAAMDGLAGPLHGLANQECLRWLLSVMKQFGGLPTQKQFESFARQTLSEGKLIPGYGHAVLRTTDPRFTAQYEFGKKYLQDDELFQLVDMIYQTLPNVLMDMGKVKNPWPNVDAINGTMQYHFGVTEFDFYTVLFGISRILGLTSHAVWARGLLKPIERPKSLTTKMLERMLCDADLMPERETEPGSRAA
ncbi:MAG: citrate (Si)-synthase [Chloroflexi bacterium]|jgi:citrate synthase|nr:citrate (Si)-synthase [Anaerolineaceae bacterium]NMB90116.1 citrate (Si)-synthase [Chloroflexota bacterium]